MRINFCRKEKLIKTNKIYSNCIFFSAAAQCTHKILPKLRGTQHLFDAWVQYVLECNLSCLEIRFVTIEAYEWKFQRSEYSICNIDYFCFSIGMKWNFYFSNFETIIPYFIHCGYFETIVVFFWGNIQQAFDIFGREFDSLFISIWQIAF